MIRANIFFRKDIICNRRDYYSNAKASSKHDANTNCRVKEGNSYSENILDSWMIILRMLVEGLVSQK